MKRTFLVVAVAVVVGVFPSISAALSTSAWANAIEVPGTAALNGGGNSVVISLSCSAAGECAAGGFYRDGSSHLQAFVADEKNGVWGTAAEVPGTAALNGSGNARVLSVSCAAPGECAAAGSYRDGSNNSQAFVVSEKKGVWGTAVEVPGTAALNTGDAQATSVSCAAAGECATGGYYFDGSSQLQVFVANEKAGVWGAAEQVPGTATLNSGGNALLNAVSCWAAGGCAAGGYYLDGSGNYQAFVVSETNGVWGSAIEVPGTAALATSGFAQVGAVSCAAAGACAASGYYRASGHYQAFVVSEKNGVWGTAVQVPGTASLNTGGDANAGAISCAAPGECLAGGYYKDGSSHHQAFVVSEKKGVWGTAVEVPGTATLNGLYASVNSLSCGAVGDCAAGGRYTDGAGHYQAFVARERSGLWEDAIEVPGTAALNAGGFGSVNSVSCAPGQCNAGGSYKDGSAAFQSFVVGGVSVSVSHCVVPHLVGKKLSAAKKALSGANCRVGKIKKVHSKAKKGHVVAQHPKPGTSLSAGSKVALTVSKGRK